MVRISWQLALLVALAIALVARRPRLLVPVLVVAVAWYVWLQARARK
jgi:hypothetical protein